MPAWLTWSAIRTFGPYILIALLAGLLVLDAEKLKARNASLIACHAQSAQFQADVKAKTAEAQAADAANKARVETAQSTITETHDADLEKELAAARADAAAYAQRLRQQSQAGAGGGGSPSVPQPAEPAGSADGTGQTPELDATACAEAVTKAQGWQDWWKDMAAVPRE